MATGYYEANHLHYNYYPDGVYGNFYDDDDDYYHNSGQQTFENDSNHSNTGF